MSNKPDKKLAAVCGLFCKGCTLYIATTEDSERLKFIADMYETTEEEISCYGCGSDKRGPYCQTCKMIVCAKEKGVEFCSLCDEYPCDHLKEFQKAAPHRIELWEDLERLKEVGYEKWYEEKIIQYSCSECKTVNSAYDLKCRKCGSEPSNQYVAEHAAAVKAHISKKDRR